MTNVQERSQMSMLQLARCTFSVQLVLVQSPQPSSWLQSSLQQWLYILVFQRQRERERGSCHLLPPVFADSRELMSESCGVREFWAGKKVNGSQPNWSQLKEEKILYWKFFSTKLQWHSVVNMVEFNFNISSIFPEEISIIGNDLIPSGYKGDTNFGFLKQKVSIRLLWEFSSTIIFKLSIVTTI